MKGRMAGEQSEVRRQGHKGQGIKPQRKKERRKISGRTAQEKTRPGTLIKKCSLLLFKDISHTLQQRLFLLFDESARVISGDGAV